MQKTVATSNCQLALSATIQEHALASGKSTPLLGVVFMLIVMATQHLHLNPTNVFDTTPHQFGLNLFYGLLS